jgi:hypothetical protein
MIILGPSPSFVSYSRGIHHPGQIKAITIAAQARHATPGRPCWTK